MAGAGNGAGAVCARQQAIWHDAKAEADRRVIDNPDYDPSKERKPFVEPTLIREKGDLSSITQAAPKPKKVPVNLTHISMQPDLTHVRTRFSGTGTIVRGAERDAEGFKGAHYFMEDTKGDYEDMFNRSGGTKYTAQPKVAIYNLSENPDGIKWKDHADLRAKLKKAGYDGYTRSNEGTSFKQVAVLFDDQAVTNAGRWDPNAPKARGPNADVASVRSEYMKGFKGAGPEMSTIDKVDETAAKKMADHYAELKSDPNDPKVKAAYKALVTETKAQAAAIEKAGYKIQYVDQDPYKNSAEMMKDVRENKTLKVLKTAPGTEHPLMTVDENNQFRAVHDFYGHAAGGHSFNALGEERAYRSHAPTFSEKARPALAAETRGQNSWVNYGPNSHLPIKERPFAEQKAALFPHTGEYGDMLKHTEKRSSVLSSVEKWTPTERGILDRSAPKTQGSAPIDPRMLEDTPKGKATELSQAIAGSKTVKAGLLDQVIRGLPMGGHTWYELAPIRQFYGESKGPLTFQDFLNAGGSASIQNPVANELSSTSVLLYAKRNGITWREAADEMLRRYPHAQKPWINADMAAHFDRADAAGMHLPSKPGSGEQKITWYSHGKLGGSLDARAALDTHERRMLGMLGMEDPKVAKLLPKGFTPGDLLPLGNSRSYGTLSQPYTEIAHNLGLPSTQAAQAGRWIGGAEKTGLKSMPTGDFTQILEDATLHNAKATGKSVDPAALRKYLHSVLQGEDFFLPFYGKGAFPVY